MVRTFIDHAQLDIPYAILCPVYFLRYPNELASHVISVDVLARQIITRPRLKLESQDDKTHTPSFSDPSSSRQVALQQRTEAAGPSRSFWGSPIASSASTESEEDVQHILKTTRLILKRGTLPKWAPSGILRNAESWVLEESEVELDSPFSSSTEERPVGEGRKMKCWTRNLDHTKVMAVTENLTFTEQLPASIETGKISTSRLDSIHDVESSVGFTLLQSRIEKFGYQRVRTHVDASRKGLWMTYSRFLQQRLQEGRMNALVVNALQGQSGIEITNLSSTSSSKRAKLLAALRPPFLDGDFVGPIARLRQQAKDVRIWWKGLVRGGTADKEHMRIKPAQTDDDGMLSPMERLRKRFLSLRDGQRLLHTNDSE
ncbi:hypothetical protein L7F22_052720 [Adiantum nelumboides]|nr:hypothetical protein [Adiantum nelumboides]